MKPNESMNEFMERRDSSFKMGLGLEIEMRSKHNKRRDSSFLFYFQVLIGW